MVKKILIGLVAALGFAATANAGDVKLRIVIGNDHSYHRDYYEPRCWTSSHYEYRHGRRVIVQVTECEQYSNYDRRDRRHHRRHHRHHH
jgi:hypothetical protein